jgi:hypothetical protein
VLWGLVVRKRLEHLIRHDVWVFSCDRSCPYMNRNSMLGALKRDRL